MRRTFYECWMTGRGVGAAVLVGLAAAAVSTVAAISLAGGWFVDTDGSTRQEARGAGVGQAAGLSPLQAVKTHLGAYQPSVGKPDIDADLNHVHVSWGGGGGEFPMRFAEDVAASGRVPLVTWEPWQPPERPSDEIMRKVQPDFAPSRLAGGLHEEYVAAWAEAAAEYGGPLLLRFMPEPNGFWYPWSAGAGVEARDYVAAWQRVHGIFREAGADNVEWVWTVNTMVGMPEGYRTVDVQRFYPGDGYVDWVGVVGLNWGDTQEWSAWVSVEELFADTLASLREYGKPVLAGVGTVSSGGDACAWVESVFTALDDALADVRAVAWFDATIEHVDFSLQPDATAALTGGMARLRGAPPDPPDGCSSTATTPSALTSAETR